jgi:hypothetical protein
VETLAYPYFMPDLWRYLCKGKEALYQWLRFLA